MDSVLLLAIESSCDDTAAAVIRNDKILANIVANQAVHEEYGGVVPELASRAHQKNIVPVIDLALKKAGVGLEEIDGIAYTRGPGLMGSLLVGTSFAKAMALAKNIPLIEVNHMHAHILAHFIKEADKDTVPSFPFLCLTVSGGHTQLVVLQSEDELEVVGATIDDAAGEAFDKIAKMLGLPYPGGPVLDRLAANGNRHRFKFTHPKVPNLDYSFSGLKTAVLYFLRSEVEGEPNFVQEHLHDLCASVQHTIVEILLNKLSLAAQKYGVKHIGLAGGVSANSLLRTELQHLGKKKGWITYIPKFEYCTDNAAMIAIAGYYNFKKGKFSDQSAVPLAGMKL
jgi:N6-L-threonylcarbamoyladenine synthase